MFLSKTKINLWSKGEKLEAILPNNGSSDEKGFRTFAQGFKIPIE